MATKIAEDYSCIQYADPHQQKLYTKFDSESLLGTPEGVDHFIQWTTFFRRNLHRFAIDYLEIRLHIYQVLILYLMGVCRFIVIIASRAAAKSWTIALFAVCQAILYPNSEIVLASATKGQAKLLVSEKIEKHLMPRSKMLQKEIKKIKSSQSETVVFFRNNSTITVVPASENGRGYRSTVLVREEFRLIKKSIDDSVLSPFQVIRNAPYLLLEYYEHIPELQESNKDIYISSSWLDNGQWMWNIVDQAYDEMMDGELFCLLAFDESVALRHNIKSLEYFQTEKKKQDSLTWRIEFMNERVKENTEAYFPYSILQKNQRAKMPFYPRRLEDVKSGKRNPYAINKQRGEVRLVCCDMAFITNKKNDNSIFSCMRLLPECTTYTNQGSKEITVDNGYRRIVCYMEAIQGGDTVHQAVRIRQLFEDFEADYIVLDMRNAGISVYDDLARVMYDEERGIEYSPLSCMNDESIAKRVRAEGANPCIYCINAYQKLNSNIAIDFKRVLENERIDLMISFEQASEEILPGIKEYMVASDADVQLFYESPFLETQAFISETTELIYEKKQQTGDIVVKEQGKNRKDRYTSCSYGSYFATQLEHDLMTKNEEYEYAIFIN